VIIGSFSNIWRYRSEKFYYKLAKKYREFYYNLRYYIGMVCYDLVTIYWEVLLKYGDINLRTFITIWRYDIGKFYYNFEMILKNFIILWRYDIGKFDCSLAI
jgi:hypothetical protein